MRFKGAYSNWKVKLEGLALDPTFDPETHPRCPIKLFLTEKNLLYVYYFFKIDSGLRDRVKLETNLLYHSTLSHKKNSGMGKILLKCI